MGRGLGDRAEAHLTWWSWLSSRKLARIAALSFWMTARSSAMVLAARTLRINCLTEMWPSIVSDWKSILGYRHSVCQCPSRPVGGGATELTGTHDDQRFKPREGGRRKAEGLIWSRVARLEERKAREVVGKSQCSRIYVNCLRVGRCLSCVFGSKLTANAPCTAMPIAAGLGRGAKWPPRLFRTH